MKQAQSCRDTIGVRCTAAEGSAVSLETRDNDERERTGVLRSELFRGDNTHGKQRWCRDTGLNNLFDKLIRDTEHENDRKHGNYTTSGCKNETTDNTTKESENETTNGEGKQLEPRYQAKKNIERDTKSNNLRHRTNM